MITEDESELNISDFNYDTNLDTPTILMNIGRARHIKEFIQIHRQI